MTREKAESKLTVRSPKKTMSLQGRKLTKPQMCVTLCKKNTRIGYSKKGEEYTRINMCEKRDHVNGVTGP